MILKNCGDHEFKRVLVPLAGGPNGGLALELAGVLAARNDGEVVALSVDTGKGTFDIDGFVEAQRGRIALPEERVTTKTIKAAYVVEVILRESESYDLIAIGCTGQRPMYQFATASIPEAVAEQSKKPVVMVKASGGIRSWLKRWM